MKNILITGKNSYIGLSLENWLMSNNDQYKIVTIDMMDELWKETDFSNYEVVFHVAGIAHIKENKKNQDDYYKVNRDLAYKTAKKAKLEGVSQFIFMSSMSVYGIEKGVIGNNTKLNPQNAYGKSKAEAESLIKNLQDESFNVSIIRPPMVYGKGCKGNYPRLVRLAMKLPLFFKVDNKRSMIYIDNLSEFLKNIIDNNEGGIFFPQNLEYVNTSEMVRLIVETHGKRIVMIKKFGFLIKSIDISVVNKIFGDLMYDMSMSEYKKNYRICGFRESIINSENES